MSLYTFPWRNVTYSKVSSVITKVSSKVVILNSKWCCNLKLCLCLFALVSLPVLCIMANEPSLINFTEGHNPWPLTLTYLTTAEEITDQEQAFPLFSLFIEILASFVCTSVPSHIQKTMLFFKWNQNSAQRAEDTLKDSLYSQFRQPG